MEQGYCGRQFVGIDLHRRRSVFVRMTAEGERLGMARVDNDAFAFAGQIALMGERPELVIESTYGWYWAADVLADAGARVHLAHPLGIKGFANRRVKNDERDAADLADLLRMGRLPEAWIAPPPVRALRELVRHRAKLVALRCGLKCQVHAVLAKNGIAVPMSDLFGVCGTGLSMLALPPVTPPIGLNYRTRLGRDYYVRVDTVDYSVDPKFIGKFVDVTTSLELVRVSCEGHIAARHIRSWAKEGVVTDPAHREAAARMRQAFAAQREHNQKRQAALRHHADGHAVALRALPDYDARFGVDFTPGPYTEASRS